jgi:hypothetical protein
MKLPLLLDPAQQQTAKDFKAIAETALGKLAAMNIQSSNKFWTRNRAEVAQKLHLQRLGLASQWPALVAQVEQSRVGNCGEKGMLFAWFASLHPLAARACIYTVEAVDWDHMWAVVTEKRLARKKELALTDLGATGIVLDGWTEDWYFPNLPTLDKIHLNTWRSATPFAYYVKSKVETQGQHFVVRHVLREV